MINRKNIGVNIFLFLLPLLLLNIVGVIVNPKLFPTYCPITFILAALAFLIGQFTRSKEAKKKKSWLFYSLLTITTFTFLFISFYFTPHNYFNLTLNRQKIDGNFNVYNKLEFSNLDGTPYQLNNLTNKTVLLDNWFLSYYQCVLKLPSLQALSEKASYDTTLKIITVINGKIDSIEEVIKFVNRHPEIKIPILYDKFNTIKNLIKIEGYPIELIIGKDGFIKERHDGFNKDERMVYVNETLKKLKKYNKEYEK